MATGWSDLSGLGKFGIISQGVGVVGGIIAADSAASAEKYKTKSLALSLEHKKDMALFNPVSYTHLTLPTIYSV